MNGRFSALFLLSASLVFAQGERGALNGTITDASGAAIPGATVIVKEVKTGVETPTTTTDAGVYRSPYLPPGMYQVTVSKTGFRSAAVSNIELRVAQTLTVDLKLELGQVSEQVTVSTEPPLIETGTSEIGRYVSKKEFDTWPVAVGDGRRQIQSFIFRSLPGTTGGEFQGSINGGQQYSHEILIDGMSLGRFDLTGGSNNELSPSAEAVSEFKLQTGTIGAQYGGGQTAVANFAIKSGTNQLHGSAYTYAQNDALRANTFQNNALGRAKPAFKQLNYGASLGGPVLIPKIYNGKNKTFFFASWEKTRERNFTSTGLGNLPTMDFRRGDFSKLLNADYTGNKASGTVVGTDALGRSTQFGQIFDPATTRTVNGKIVRDAFPGNIIPENRWDPVAKNILTMAPITTPINGNLLNNINTLDTSAPVFDETMVTFKGDHYFNSAHRMGIYYGYNDRVRNNSPAGRWGVPPNTPTGVYQLQSTPGKIARITEDWTITPTILNHFGIGYNRFGNYNESVFVDQDWPSKIGLQNVAQTTFPALVFQGQAILGGNIGSVSSAGGRLGSINAGFTFNGSTIIQDDLTIVRGKHNIKLGTEMRMYYYNTRNKSGSGTFNFNSAQTQQGAYMEETPVFTPNASTGHAFASFLLGAVNSTNRDIILTSPGHRTRYPAFYASDDWKISRKLTLNYGLRWEIIGGIYEVAGRMTNLDPSKANPTAGGVNGALVFADDLGRKGFQQRNWTQFSPRIGFAYAITDKMVMRGGWGVNNMAPVTNFSLPSAFGYNGTILANNQNTNLTNPSVDPVMFLSQPYPNFAGTLPNKNPSLQNGQDITYIAPDGNRLGYVQNFNLGFQFQLPGRFVLETSYIGNIGNRIVSRGLDRLNQLPVSALQYGDALLDPLSSHPGLVPVPYAGFTGTVAQALRQYPQYQNVSQYLPNFGHSNYNSLQVSATRHLSNGLAVLAAYTFSKAIADADSTLDPIAAQDVFNRRLERSITAYHVPQFLKLTWIYELPIGPGKALNIGGLPGKVIGGWVVTGVQSYRSGDPLAVTTTGLQNMLFSGAIRPDLVAGEQIVIDQGGPVQFGSGTPYLNPKAFAQVPTTKGNVPLRLGTLGRYLPNVRGPAVYSEDFGVSKRFAFTETAYLEFRGEAFNAFNRAGRANPNLDTTNPLFGKITASRYGPRSLQLQLRINF